MLLRYFQLIQTGYFVLNLLAILKKHLIIFTRYPEPGKTKIRLIPALATAFENLQTFNLVVGTATMVDIT